VVEENNIRNDEEHFANEKMCVYKKQKIIGVIKQFKSTNSSSSRWILNEFASSLISFNL